jgi:hypothetical protein
MTKRDDQNDNDYSGSSDAANEAEINKRSWSHDQDCIHGSRHLPDEQERPISDTVEPPED